MIHTLTHSEFVISLIYDASAYLLVFSFYLLLSLGVSDSHIHTFNHSKLVLIRGENYIEGTSINHPGGVRYE